MKRATRDKMRDKTEDIHKTAGGGTQKDAERDTEEFRRKKWNRTEGEVTNQVVDIT